MNHLGFGALLLSHINIYYCLSVDYKYFKAIHGTGMISKNDNKIYKTIEGSSQPLCVIACGADDSCQGYNYFPELKRCELLLSACPHGKQFRSEGDIYMERFDKRKCIGYHFQMYTIAVYRPNIYVPH